MEYKEKWIQAFCSGTTAREVQKLGKMSKDTYYQLKADDAFMALVKERRDAVVKAAVNMMAEFIGKDILILQHEIIENKTTSKQTRMLAIKTMLTTFTAWRTETDVLERLEALEQAQDDLRTDF